MSFLPYETARPYQWTTPLTLSLALHGAAVVVFLTAPFVTFDPPAAPQGNDMIIRLEILDLEGMLETVPVMPTDLNGTEIDAVPGDEAGSETSSELGTDSFDGPAIAPEIIAEQTPPEETAPIETPPDTVPMLENIPEQADIAPFTTASIPFSPLDNAAILSPLAEPRAPAKDTRDTALAPPTPQPEDIPPPEVLTPEDVAIEVAAIEPPVSDVAAPLQAGTLPPALGTPLAAPDEATRLIGALLSRIRSVEAPPCTIALPRRSTEARVGLSLIGPDRDALSLYGAQLSEGLPTPVSSVLEVVDPRQCAALDALAQTTAYPASRIGFQLESSTLTNGETLQARVIGAGGLALAVLLIDDNGIVQDLSRFTTLDGADPVIAAPVSRAGEGRDTRQLLIVFGTTGVPLAFDGFDGRPAQALFNSLDPQRLAQSAFAVVSFDVR